MPAIPLALSRPKLAKAPPKDDAIKSLAAAEVNMSENVVEAPPHAAGQEAEVIHEDVVAAKEVQEENVDANAPEPAVSNGTTEVGAMDSHVSDGSASMDLSNGATPEPTCSENKAPETPVTVSSTTATASPTFSRKPDRLDMRQIRTELPPAFVPSTEQQTPLSASSAPSQRLPYHSLAHPSHPSTGSIVFGGPESQSSSPAPPTSAGHTFAPPQFPPYANGQQQPYFVPHGHAHHFSDPQTQHMYQPMYPQPPMSYNTRRDFYSPSQAPYFHPSSHAPFRYPPREAFTPAAEQVQTNGGARTSRPASQASSARPDGELSGRSEHGEQAGDGSAHVAEADKVMFNEPKAAFPDQMHLRQPQRNRNMPPLPQPYATMHPDVSADFDNTAALRDHILSYSHSNDLADVSLAVLDSTGMTTHTLLGHSLILARSPKLLALMRRTEQDAGTRTTQLQVLLNDAFRDEAAFTTALRYLYGGPLLQGHHFVQGLPPPRRDHKHADDLLDVVEQHMQYLLSYSAAGAFLQISPIADRGIDIATRLLRWETMEIALAYALDGGINATWQAEENVEDRVSTASSDDSFARPEALTTPTYDPYATRLLHRIIDFTVNTFPPDFFLDTSAKQLERAPRLPRALPTHESRPSHSDPRMSRIRFGELPVDEPQRPPFITTTISSVLLSLPFLVLKCLLEHHYLINRLGVDTVASIMRAVVVEREVRRVKALKAHMPGRVDDSVDGALVQNLYWEESVEPSSQHRAGHRLVRKRRGIDTPPSSGAGSERSK